MSDFQSLLVQVIFKAWWSHTCVGMTVNKRAARNISVLWNAVVCALREGSGVLLAQLLLSKAIPGQGSEGVKSQELFTVGSLYTAARL